MRSGPRGREVSLTSMLAAVLVLGLCLLPSITAFTRRTSGHGGDLCENGTRRCLKGSARCENNKCVCTKGTADRGSLMCTPTGHLSTQMISDPLMHTLGQEACHVPVPCRFLYSHFTTVFKGWFGGSCNVQIYAYNAKYHGKIYVKGIDMALSIVTPFTKSPDGEISIRLFAHASGGKYTFEEHGSHKYAPDGPWESGDKPTQLYVPGAYVQARHDPYNNLVYIKVDPCGFQVTLRPPDLMLGKDQFQVPGLSLTVNPANAPNYHSLTETVSLPPLKGVSLYSMARAQHMSPSECTVNKVLTAGVEQNQPDAAPMCGAMASKLEACRTKMARSRGFKACMFILTTPPLIRCYDDSTNGDGILTLFGRCVVAICTSSWTDCKRIQAEVKPCNTKDNPEVVTFLQPSTCNR